MTEKWIAQDNGDGGATVKSEAGGYIASVQWKGNAPLVAAAPSMLEALRAFVAARDGSQEIVDADTLARAAIGAATGEAVKA